MVTVPRVVREWLGWRPGSLVLLEVTPDDNLRVSLFPDPKSAPVKMQPLVTQVIEEAKR